MVLWIASKDTNIGLTPCSNTMTVLHRSCKQISIQVIGLVLNYLSLRYQDNSRSFTMPCWNTVQSIYTLNMQRCRHAQCWPLWTTTKTTLHGKIRQQQQLVRPTNIPKGKALLLPYYFVPDMFEMSAIELSAHDQYIISANSFLVTQNWAWITGL